MVRVNCNKIAEQEKEKLDGKGFWIYHDVMSTNRKYELKIL